MEYGTHDDDLWDGSGQTGEGASSSQNENEGSLEELSE
jgi:hypothetical protein